ncbi:unnamed protein product [Calypogeia fissa]
MLLQRFPVWTSRPIQIPCCTRPLPSAATFVMASISNNTTVVSAPSPQPVTPSTTDMKLLFVEMGTGYDQHGQNITTATMRACKNAISSNSIPAFRTGALPGVSYQQMKLKIKLGVPHSVQHELDIEQVKSVFPYGNIVDVEVVDGGLICSSGVALEAMGDKNDNCYVVNAAIYVGY